MNSLHFKSNVQLPSESKGYSVGFARFNLVETGRKDSFNKTKDRQFEVLTWYPADDNFNHSPMVHLGKGERDKSILLRLRFGWQRVGRFIGTMSTNSYFDAPVSELRAQYPILLFSHELGSMPEYYTKLMESLAKEGYFIFSINHPHLSQHCSTSSGEVKFKFTIGLAWWFVLRKAKRIATAKNYYEKWLLSTRLLHKGFSSLTALNNEMHLDRRFLLSFLEQIDSTVVTAELPYKRFAGRLDLSRVGVIGHGWGGISAVQSLIQESRVRAAVNLDGFQFCHGFNHVIKKPLLMIYSPKYSGINGGIYFCDSIYESFTVNNSDYHCFSDLCYMLAESKTINDQISKQTLDLVLRFFKEHVKDVDVK